MCVKTDGSPLITVKEARKLLVGKSKNLTNKELEELISNTETVARIAIRRFISSINSKNNGTINSEKVGKI